MIVGTLKKLLDPLDDDMDIVVVGNALDEDGDDEEVWFAIHEVTRELDHDTADYYVRFGCERLEDVPPA